jgi:cytochrome c
MASTPACLITLLGAALLATGPGAHAAPAAPAAPEDARFKVEKLLGDIPQPMTTEIGPDGRLYFNEYGGLLKAIDLKTKQVKVIGKLEVFLQQENGFLSFALDPKFAENGWVYCLYSPVGFNGQSVSRFTIKDDVLDLRSEKVLLRYDEQRKECCHHGGSMLFGPDGNLYWSAGDNTHPFGDSQSFSPADERPGREPWDAQKSAANTMSLAGKVNRIRPKADGTYEIPAGNLFPVGTPKTRPEIFAMGCRNPWRLSIDRATGFVYWGEVGPDANNDGPRGSRGYDEINQARKAGNFGWPYFVGDNFPYAKVDFATGKVGPMAEAAHPRNTSPNNTGLNDLPAATPAFIYWPYKSPKKWPELGEGGRTACAGPVFHYSPSFEKTDGFPEHFDRCLLFWDWQRPFIKWARLDADSNLVGIEPFTNGKVVTGNSADQVKKLQPAIANGSTLMKRPVHAVFGPDGCLYFMDYGETWGANHDSGLYKISYVRGNLPPIAKASLSVASGKAPLAVKLSAAGSSDPEGKALTYTWKLQPGGRVLGEGAETSVTLTQAGNFSVELTAKDADGGEATTSLPIVIGNTAPQVRFETPQNGDFFTPGKKVPFKVAVQDDEDGSSADKALEFGLRAFVSSGFVAGDGKAEATDPGLTLLRQSDCLNCHATEAPLVGPSFLAIADKYRGVKDAPEALNKKVRLGGSGVWGQVPMLAHPQHTVDEVAFMLRWILALEKGKGGPAITRGLVGEVTAPKADKPGQFVLEATYTDAGAGPAGPLAGKATVALRTRRIEAETAELNGAKNTGKVVGSTNHGHTLKFTNLNLTDSKSVTILASAGSSAKGSKVEVRLDAPNGPLLGTVDITHTGDWGKYAENTAPLAASTGRHDVYLVLVNPGKGGLMNIDWVQFNP